MTNLPDPSDQLATTVTIGARPQKRLSKSEQKEREQRRSLSGQSLRDSRELVPARKRTASAQPPRRVVLSPEEEEKRKRKDKERRKAKRKERKKEKKLHKEEERARKKDAAAHPASQGPAKGKEESKEPQDDRIEAVVAGGAGWKEHLQNLWDEDFETSFRSTTAALADSSPFTSPLAGSSAAPPVPSARRVETLASSWAADALASPANTKRGIDLAAETYRSLCCEDEEGSMITGGAGKVMAPRSAEQPRDDWRNMLRQGWREELSRMDKSKASLLQPKSLIFEEEEESTKSKKKNDPAARRKKIRTKLKRYKSSLKAALNQSTATMKDIRNDARTVKVGAKGELAKYTLWRRPALKRLARQLIHLRLARFDLMERIEERKIALVAARLDATKAVMQRWKEGETLAANDRSLFLKPDVLFIQDERLATLRLRLTVLSQQRRLLAVAYNQQLNEALEDTEQTRALRLRQLLASVESNPRGFHPLDELQQSTFDSFLLDQRFKEGRRVQRLQTAIAESMGKFLPDDILSFLTSMVSDMAQDHQLNESEQQKLRLFVSRAVFPLIHNDIYPDPDPADDVYVVQAKNFAALPPSALHIPPENYRENSNYSGLYRAASDKLNDLYVTTVPTDALNTLVEVMNLINDEAKERSGASGVGADDLLPLFQLALVHSLLFDVHRLVRFIEDWSYESEKHGEYGWSLTTLSAASQHIAMFSPEASEESGDGESGKDQQNGWPS